MRITEYKRLNNDMLLNADTITELSWHPCTKRIDVSLHK